MGKDILIRNVPDEIVEAIENEAAIAGTSRQELLVGLLSERFGGENSPLRAGEGLKGLTPTGGVVVIRSLGPDSPGVQGGAKNLMQDEFDAYQRAKLLADSRNGSRWQEARRVLEEAGFEVFNV